MTEASNLWFQRVDRAFEELQATLEENRRALIVQAAARSELRLAILRAQVADVQDAVPPPEQEAQTESRAA